MYTLKINLTELKLKLTELEKVRFTKMNELKLAQVELFSLFRFKSVAANVSESFCAAL